ncbi:hypothetical protein M7I_5096 [Glarea lozoyensis 74030]|uniref:Uncharacterized protein n=1 Tax=Glarea lozoyensis (strain ATCC 74030 / MF5533) TaxID=1104152 RepID=H0EQY7_GLAL7|nr:hypothetical protein M7I_5096 [Glarea lozoyensis 74030]
MSRISCYICISTAQLRLQNKVASEFGILMRRWARFAFHGPLGPRTIPQ